MPSLYQALERRARPHLHRPALTTPEGERWTYRELFARASWASARLAELGLKPGDRALFLLPNSPSFAAALLGCFRAGVVAAPLDPRCTPRELWAQAHLVRPRALVAPRGLARALSPVARLAGIPRTLSVEELCAPTETLNPPATIQPRAPAEILFTSGTTGGTKGVALSHEGLLANARACARAFCTSPEDRLLGVLPFFHSFGSTAGLLTALYSVSSLEVHARFSPADVYESLARGRLSVLPGVPAMFALLLKNARERGLRLRLHGVRCVSGGAPLSPRESREFHEWFGTPITEGYGLTEAGPVVSVDDFRRPTPGCVGRPLLGVRVRIHSRGRPLPAGRIGEVWVRSPSLMLGYWNDSAATRRALRGSWLRTGDCGYLDTRGRLFLTGRAREFINVGGFKVWPREVEAALEEHPAVAEAAVLGAPDEVLGEVPVALLVPRAGAKIPPAALERYCRERLSPHKVPRRFSPVRSLPHTRMGKVDRRRLQVF